MLILIIIIYGILISQLILLALYNYLFLFILGPLFIFLICKIKYQYKVYLTLLTIAFPLPMNLLGRDAGTLTTFIIIFIYFISIAGLGIRIKLFSHNHIEKLIYLMGIIGLFGTFAVAADFLITSVRYYLIFVSSILLFLMIIKAPITSEKNAERFIEKMIDIILIVCVIQCLIGFLITILPQSGMWFKIFLPGKEEMLALRVTDDVARFRTLIGGPEPSGEMLAILSPIVLYKYLTSNKKFYLGIFIIYGIAEILTATRSTVILFVLGAIATLLFYAKEQKIGKSIKLIIVLSLIVLPIMVAWPDLFSGLLHRFTLAQESLNKGQELSSILNRGYVWDCALQNLKKAAAFGHGFLPASYYLGPRVNFHCLYLTVIYQMGWIGACIFYVVLSWIYIKLYSRKKDEKDNRLKFLLTCCWISMSIFLINEIKYEFNRHAPYQQLCWAMFGLFYYVASYRHHFLKTSIKY